MGHGVKEKGIFLFLTQELQLLVDFFEREGDEGRPSGRVDPFTPLVICEVVQQSLDYVERSSHHQGLLGAV